MLQPSVPTSYVVQPVSQPAPGLLFLPMDSDTLAFRQEETAVTTWIADGAAQRDITDDALHAHLDRLLQGAGGAGERVLILPPDHTRLYSRAGDITDYLYKRLVERGCAVEIMPALGTHAPMTEAQLRMMFGPDIPLEAFRVHDWRNDVVRAGAISGAELNDMSDGRLEFDVEVVVNQLLLNGGHDRILSVGQVVPHEVVGMANFTKNLCVGVGGPDLINKSHFLGAVCDMETILGRAKTPVRRLFDMAHARFLSHLPVTFVLTVVEDIAGTQHLRGLFAGDDQACFMQAAELSKEVNLTLLDEPMAKAVVYLTPKEFASTWLGNKAVYRTRMAIADGGELIILAPGVKEFGEDPTIDRLIRRHGYRGTETTLAAVQDDEELAATLGAAAHLIHGSSEGRFRITYCTRPELLSREEVESVGYAWADYDEMAAKVGLESLSDGPQTAKGESFYYVSNPALGLWALRDAFEVDA